MYDDDDDEEYSHPCKVATLDLSSPTPEDLLNPNQHVLLTRVQQSKTEFDKTQDYKTGLIKHVSDSEKAIIEMQSTITRLQKEITDKRTEILRDNERLSVIDSELREKQGIYVSASLLWNSCHKGSLLTPDGSSLLSMDAMVLVFGWLWKPGSYDRMREAVMFQRTCKVFDQVSQRYIKHNRTYIPTVRMNKETTDVNFHAHDLTLKGVALRIKQTKKQGWTPEGDAMVEIPETFLEDTEVCFEQYRNCDWSNYDGIALMPLKEAPDENVLVVQSYRYGGGCVYLVGGEYEPDLVAQDVEGQYEPVYIERFMNWVYVPLMKITEYVWPDYFASIDEVTIKNTKKCTSTSLFANANDVTTPDVILTKEAHTNDRDYYSAIGVFDPSTHSIICTHVSVGLHGEITIVSTDGDANNDGPVGLMWEDPVEDLHVGWAGDMNVIEIDE